MPFGLAIPLALTVFTGVLLGRLAPPLLIEGLGLALLLALALRRRAWVLWLLLMAGVAAVLLLARGAELPAGLSREDLALEGQVLSVGREGPIRRLNLAVERCEPLAAPRRDCDDLDRVRLSWRDGPELVVGERWALGVRLRPPSGFANPDAFDYRAWLWREGLQATGYVRDDPAPRRLAEAGFSVRRAALDHLDEGSLPPRASRWLAALTLGASERLTRADWDLLNASGTTHLMVISGLHVGLVAAFALLVSRGVARLATPGGWRLAVWPWWLAGVAAAGYAMLAGLEPPALRALVMTLVGLWIASGRHAPGPWQAWWLALGLVVLLDPLSAWRPGLWLSFVAVALLILVWQGRAKPRGARGWLWALLRSQLLLAPLMAAAVLLAFDRLAPAAPLVNLVAVPLVSSLMVPLGLLGWGLAWLPPASELCWWLFAWLVGILASALEVAVQRLPVWWPAPGRVMPLAFCLAGLSMAWALPGLARPLRLSASLLLLAVALTLPSPGPEPGQLRVRVHDVGQGQLVELRTRRYRALVDTGPRFGSGFAPLETLWSPGQVFDDVIVSHDDLDHAGGLTRLAEDHRVERYLAPAGEALDLAFRPCRSGRRWERDGVVFRFLWPPEAAPALDDNDRSCVLEARAGGSRLLITGDVGREVERALLLEVSGPPAVLVAGHHGSRTSSGPQFVSELAPRHVVFSAGRDNPFGHPADAVVRRFRQAGSCLWNTAHDGALTLWLGRGPSTPIQAQRHPPWRHGGVGDGCLAIESPHDGAR